MVIICLVIAMISSVISIKVLEKMEKTIINVTHDINVAKKCERIIYIEDGKVKES